MKLRSLLVTTAATAAIFAGSPAQALVLDFSGSNVDMGHAVVGQTGTITDIYSNLFALPPNVAGGGTVYGYIPTHSVINFTYTFTGLSNGVLNSYSSYDYTAGGHHYTGSSTGNSSTGVVNHGEIDGLATYSKVFSTANLTVVNPGTSTGATQIANYAPQYQQFSSGFFGILSTLPPGVGTITYSVSQIPLPASLPMSLAAIGGLFAYAYGRKRKALAA